MHQTIRIAAQALFCLVVGAAQMASGASCPPEGHDRGALEALKTREFVLADDAARQALAMVLLPCLSHADPALRDGIAFEAYAAWLRADKIDVATRRELLSRLTAMLQAEPADPAGFRQPFAALVLSEVARTDRIKPWMTADQRTSLVTTAAHYVENVRDYRGFDAQAGWRHGVAHGADLLLQLALNPALDRAGLDRILAAVAAQVTPAGNHVYVYGESERLARPVLFVAQRALYSGEEWQQWLAGIAAPAPLPDWGAAFASQAGLAKRHNVRAFLFALYVSSRDSTDPGVQLLVPALQAVLKTLR